MADNTPKLYEGMFLMSQASVSAGLGNALDIVRGMLDRADAEVLTLAKWEERKLAYPINGHKRGTFLLTLFKVAPTQIANIERDCNLSEDVVRVMMTRADHMGETEIAEALKAAEAAGDAANLEEAEAASAEA
ncbi:30S ribosomal protein S6 [Algisphaera agarilytica]|uniref:Small ribosomal subunit protein bS6 n=1 Tax=Algisphaera agarilytica TaxID=1385975 RepID=A0A7X0HAK8_9BACT|nr:30S ribosomal protein S6 [Algisphaera agarilytica]MBB6430854.1 small subunit ribosomal protein S6 [Algisphaera agarilytica]